MNPIVPEINVSGVKIKSFLFAKMNPDYLVEDVLTVALPNGYFITAGWHPAHDPKGGYVIRVFWEYADNPAQFPVTARTTDEVVVMVQELAYRFSQRQRPSSPTTTGETKRFLLGSTNG
jgi:hypothetical protein